MKVKRVLQVLYKKADRRLNRMYIPKKIIEKYGSYFIMKVYNDGSMEIIPAKKDEEFYNTFVE